MTPPAPKVSVVIPARDAEETLEATLDSLAAQTESAWEAIVVDDGSHDGTRALAERRAAADGRIRVIGHARSAGVSAARNRGTGEARADALLFLDADDLLAPEALELLYAALEDPRVDAAHSGWARMAADGTVGAPSHAPGLPDLFPTAARSYPFAVHACLVRRAVVEAAGGFDPSFVVCEDWDLWQRVARAGARFARVDRVAALCRLRPDAASLDTARFLTHARRVIDTGHGPDPRVAHPHPGHAAGAAPGGRAAALLAITIWAAGVAIGRGQSARDLPASVPPGPAPTLAPGDLAELLCSAVPTGAGRTERAWPELYDRYEAALTELAAQLEDQTASPGFARRILRRLESLVVVRGGIRGPQRVGATWAATWDLEAEPPREAHAACDRLLLAVELEGQQVATLELPVIEAGLDPGVLADALPDAVLWDLLGRHFARTLLPGLAIDHRPGEVGVRRGDVVLASGVAEDDVVPERLHDLVGWTLLLQEAWARPGWPGDRFHAPAPAEPAGAGERGPVRVLDLADPLPVEQPPDGVQQLEVQVAGVGLAVVAVSPEVLASEDGVISAVTEATGFELCRAVVREALLGRPLSDPGSLRERLLHARAARSGERRPPAAPGWDAAVRRAARPGAATLVLGRRPGPAGSSAWRRAVLPRRALAELAAAAARRGEPAVVVPAAASPAVGVYAPDALWAQAVLAGGALTWIDAGAIADGGMALHLPSPPAGTTVSRRSDFERMFAGGADPWRYESAYERRKYEQTLQVIGNRRVGRALEVGCAEGHFTVALARHAGALVAADISSIALQRARARCEAAGFDAVDYVRLDINADPVPRGFDLIVASEILYYLPDREALTAVLVKLAGALRPGGRLVCAHANLLVDDPDRTGFDWDYPYGARVIGEALAAVPGLDPDVELRTDLYRVHAARQPRRLALRRRGGATPRVIEAEAVDPDPDVATTLRVGGGEVATASAVAPRTSPTVPILMYHRVAASGPDALARWRIDPAALEEQLAYLHDAGYVTLDLDTWAAQIAARAPAPGRAVVLTFDDAYVDVAEHVLPMLRRHGFTATVFVPTDHVGATSAWDAHLATPAPIMDWDALAEVAAAGVTVASHAASHRPLTALSHDDVVLEVLRSRAALEERLGRPVTAIAYPYGDHDAVVRHLVGAAGLQIGLTSETRHSHVGDEPLALPRIEIEGTDRLEDLVRKLG